MCISSIVVDGTLSWTQGRKLREQKHSKGPRLVGAVQTGPVYWCGWVAAAEEHYNQNNRYLTTHLCTDIRYIYIYIYLYLYLYLYLYVCICVCMCDYF